MPVRNPVGHLSKATLCRCACLQEGAAAGLQAEPLSPLAEVQASTPPLGQRWARRPDHCCLQQLCLGVTSLMKTLPCPQGLSSASV